jgi:hypothetical protein
MPRDLVGTANILEEGIATVFRVRTERKDVDWTEQTQSKVQWQVFLNAVVNIWG